MGRKHTCRASPRRGRLVRMIVVRTTVSTAMLLGSLYGGLATGQQIVAYEQRVSGHKFEQPVPACIRDLPHAQLAAVLHSRHRRAAVLPDCYRAPRRLVPLDAEPALAAQAPLRSRLLLGKPGPQRPGFG
jgi:hypothetical protein